mgnify:CR=1 FL=1
MEKRIYQGVIAGLLLMIVIIGGMYVKAISKPETKAEIPQIAVVNINEVIAKSPLLKELNKENAKRLQELSDWVDQVNQKIEAEKDPEKHNQLADQYINLTKDKEAFIKQEYERRMQDIGEKITVLIDKVAKDNGCYIVLPTTSIISGGKNITDDVLNELR